MAILYLNLVFFMFGYVGCSMITADCAGKIKNNKKEIAQMILSFIVQICSSIGMAEIITAIMKPNNDWDFSRNTVAIALICISIFITISTYLEDRRSEKKKQEDE